MTPEQLRGRAREEADDLGPEPHEQRQRDLWAAERHGAVVLLASLAEWDAPLLKRAALETADEWTNAAVRDLLLDATREFP